MKAKKNVTAIVLAILLVISCGFNISQLMATSELQQQVETLDEAWHAAQDDAEEWRQKYNSKLTDYNEQVDISESLRNQYELAREQADRWQERYENATQSEQSSDTQSQGSGTQSTVTVYVTNSGAKYHRWGCQYLWNSSIAVALDYALASGYTPCSRCNPPRG